MAEPTIGRNFKTKFEVPNEYLENILITDSDFILSDRTSAICITAVMSFKSRLEADFKREYQNVEFLFRQGLPNQTQKLSSSGTIIEELPNVFSFLRSTN